METVNDVKSCSVLRQMVENTAHKAMRTPKDFDYLSGMIFERTHEMVSSFTLKRFWGYINRGGTSETTLSLLARFVGYGDWTSFCHSIALDQPYESEPIRGQQLNTCDLRRGDRVIVTWRPDRRLVARYEGADLFSAVESVNSKLPVGTTFHCSLFVTGHPLMLSCVVIPGESPTSYVCGAKHGIQFHVEKDA